MTTCYRAASVVVVSKLDDILFCGLAPDEEMKADIVSLFDEIVKQSGASVTMTSENLDIVVHVVESLKHDIFKKIAQL